MSLHQIHIIVSSSNRTTDSHLMSKEQYLGYEVYQTLYLHLRPDDINVHDYDSLYLSKYLKIYRSYPILSVAGFFGEEKFVSSSFLKFYHLHS